MAKIVNDNRLTVNEAALIFCILGSPDPKRKTDLSNHQRVY